MPWDQLGIYMYNHGCQVIPVTSDGFCFLKPIDLALYCDHNEVETFDNLASNILGHLLADIHYYEWFHTGDVLKDAEGYFKFGSYSDSIVNDNF